MDDTAQTVEVPSQRYVAYVVRSRLGVGGQAEVFLAEAVDEKGEHLQVALKLARPGVGEEALADEADVMSLVSHPNLVRLLEVGQAWSRPFIAMEYCVGGDLRHAMDAHRRQMTGFPLRLGVHVVLKVLEGLAAFHRATSRSGAELRLVHSDVNPANVFFTGHGQVKLGDFGVATSGRIASGSPLVGGKLWYLSPEQTRGEPLTAASDLWAVGVMLYELVVGYHPFEKAGATDEEAFAIIRSGKAAVPEYIDKPLAFVLQKALALEPRNRFRTAGEFAGALLTYSLDHGLQCPDQEVQEWLEGLLGLLV